MRRNATSSNLITLGGSNACDADLAASKRTIKRNVSWCGDLSSIKRIPSKTELHEYEKTALWYKGADFGQFASAEIARRREMGIDSMQALCPGAEQDEYGIFVDDEEPVVEREASEPSAPPGAPAPPVPHAPEPAKALPAQTGPPGCPPPPGWRQGPPGCPPPPGWRQGSPGCPPPPAVAPLPLPQATAVNEALPEVLGGRERETGCCWLSPGGQSAARSHWDWRAPEMPMSRVRAGV